MLRSLWRRLAGSVSAAVISAVAPRELARALPMPPAPPGVLPKGSKESKARNSGIFWRKLAERLRGIHRPVLGEPMLRSKVYGRDLPAPPPGVLPKGLSRAETARGSMALDGAISSTYAFAAGATWQGAGFLGYPLLAELFQIPEFASPCRQLANDMTRQWGKVTSNSKDGDKDQIAEKIKLIDAEFDRLGAREHFRAAMEDDNCFGVGRIFIDLGDDHGPELASKLDPKIKIKKGALRALKRVEASWVYPARYNTISPLQDNFYRPETWYVMGEEVHSSRLLGFCSRPMKDLLKPSYMFGGMSLIQMMWVCVENWMRTRQSVSDLVNAFSIMVLATDTAQETQPTEGAATLFDRAEAFNLLRSNLGLFVVNKETEDFKNVSAPLGGLHELQAQAQEHQASVALIPLVVMFGISPSGLNASSEGELIVYEGNIKSTQERIGTPNIMTLLHCVQMNLFGEIDDSLGWAWNPLREMTEKEDAELSKLQAERDVLLIDAGVIAPEESRGRLAADENSPFAAIDVEDVPTAPDPASEGDPSEDPQEGGAAPVCEHGIHGGGR